MSFMELIPIGTILAYLTNDVLQAAVAAKDVLIEKESFKTLSNHLYDIAPVLKELQARELNESPAARQALEYLTEDVRKAKNLVEKYKNRARFYLLINCRRIVKEVQDVTRDIGRSLKTLSLASTEVLTDISDKVKVLHDEMQKAEFQASQSQLRIVEKLNQGLLEQNSDLGFANDLLAEIAMQIGVPVEPTEISKELDCLRMEKEEAAYRKEQAEEFFLDQVIKILSLADAASDQEVRKQYKQRVQTIENFVMQDEYIPPLEAFMCPIEKVVMVEPVSICTGTTCEKRAIEAWFGSGNTRDPETGETLENLTFRLNVGIKVAIQEWRELNYCLKIRSAKLKLQDTDTSLTEEALEQIQELVKENTINKDWLAIEGFIQIFIDLLSLSNRDVKRKILVTLMALVEGHTRNKDRIIESGGLDQIILCLGRDTYTAKAAIDLLFELLQDQTGWNPSVSAKLTKERSAILFLVTLLKRRETESAETARLILLKLCEDNDDNILAVAAAQWYTPLIDRFYKGPEQSRLVMAKALADDLELVEEDKKLLGEEGLISCLVEMLTGNLESKDSAFSALSKLSSSDANKRLIAKAGAVTIVLDHMFSPHVPTKIRAKCSEILCSLSGKDEILLLDSEENMLDLEAITINLLATLQNNPTVNITIKKSCLCALLGLYKSGSKAVEKAVAGSNGVSIVLPLLEDNDSDIREISLALLYRFSQHEPAEISDFLLLPRRLDAFVSFLEEDNKADVQMAAAGLLANLPKSTIELTENLIKSNGLASILNILKLGTTEAKENALGCLFRFVDPSNVEMQKKVVELGVFPHLIGFLKSNSIIIKARSAALLGCLSQSSSSLTIPSKTTGWWCFRRTREPVCGVHGGICSVKTSFCLVSANALPDLVNLLQERVHEIAYESVQTLGTLILSSSSNGGANILHKNEAIHPLLNILEWGTQELKEQVLGLLEKVFTNKDLADQYCQTARIPLLGLSRNHEEAKLALMAARVLAKLERYSQSLPLR